MTNLRSANRRQRRVAARREPAPLSQPPCAWLLDASASRSRSSENPWHAPDSEIEIVGHADIPGGGRLSLAQCGDHFSIQFDTDELMGTVAVTSERALATLAYARSNRADGRVLIGGLGMGFTLRAALAAWGPAASIVVAELVPGVVAWAKGPLAPIFGDSLDDPRVTIEEADVHDLIARADEAFDVILLDVDNGPDGFMRPENDRLYCDWGLRSARDALKPGGTLAIWSSYPDRAFGGMMDVAGLIVETVEVPAFEGSVDDRHVIWFGRKPLR